MEQTQPIAWWVQHLSDRTTRGIALETMALVRSGALAVGSQLPPVRDLAQALGVSPATISGAWGELRRYKIINGRGRNGVWVCGDKVSPHPQRFEIATAFGQHIVADLSFATPDPALLPDPSRALAEGLRAPDINTYNRAPIVASLREAAARRWPYRPEALLATNGGYEALLLALQTLVLPGSVVAIEDPSATRILDILEYLGAQVVPVACDSEGPQPTALREALKRKPVAFVYQPRTHATTGIAVSGARLDELAKLLARSETLMVEDDGLGDIASYPAVSLGERFPERTVHIVSYSKSLGPDLRLAVLSSSADIVGRIQAFRNFGARWTSRILQGAAAWMLDDPEVSASVAHARGVYAERRNGLLAALRQRGVRTESHDGLSLWIPVESEQFALVTMAARGIAVLPGSRFCLVNARDHIRVGTGMLTENIEMVADAIALAARLR
ncbi:Putative N-acetyl-LL-diaminopimelate aminotransferase [Pandoraea terrae]|uniref:N-acetyl-LL-diaminopimelate aminotransferase n=1 Tax=Pandoraea terrae TaxID=1537710 RepID=A0A5E4W9Y6_9BURK|nr:aminotransferase class I/II-fold pyridoxal phosphate-dependent enzyme [Pandoraea terrae]VVE19895.1 Putative N-acetyl-LL-diaminopimelate aminotransferase [Pandoraea terrae]